MRLLLLLAILYTVVGGIPVQDSDQRSKSISINSQKKLQTERKTAKNKPELLLFLQDCF